MSISPEIGVDKELNLWFDNFIGELRSDELSLEIGVASPEKKELYDIFMKGSNIQVAQMGVMINSAVLISEMVKEYVSAIRESGVKLRKLAFDWSLNKVRVWAEINDNDEETENALILAEAKANAKSQKSGFYVSSTIVEESDKLQVPPHYRSMPLTQK